MLSQQSLLSFMCFRPFCVAYPLFVFLKVVEFGSFEKGYLNQPSQLCWVKAVISLLTLGFAPTSFSSSFPFHFPFSGMR